MTLTERITREYLEEITHPGNDNPPYFSDEAIALIKHYVSPYLNELDQITDFSFDEIIIKYPKKIMDGIYYIQQYWGFKLSNKDEHESTLDATKIAVMDVLMENILRGDEIFFYNDFIDPWDIESHFRSSEILRELFHLSPFPKEEGRSSLTIDVDVIINNKTFTHEMSKELASGIIVFYGEVGQSIPLSIYGSSFKKVTFDLLPIVFPEDRFVDDYTIQVKDHTYRFHTPEFVRGLITASQWLGIEPHTYITNLKHYKYQGGPGVITIPLTF